MKFINNSNDIDSLLTVYSKISNNSIERESVDNAVQFCKGNLYYMQHKDYDKAFECYLKSAEQGYSQAQYNLASMYEKGEGTEVNYEEALKWYKKSKDSGHRLAKIGFDRLHKLVGEINVSYDSKINDYLNKIYKLREILYKKYRICLDKIERINNKSNDIELDIDLIAKFNLGMMYYNKGIKQSYVRSNKFFHDAADKKHPIAMYNIGVIHYNGSSVERNYEKAMTWFKKSAYRNYAQAQVNVGIMYYHGIGTSKNYDKAFMWFSIAARQCNYQACFNIGCMFYDGNGVNKDYYEASKWFKIAADKGNLESQVNLAYMYQKGNGILKNDKIGCYWYKKIKSEKDKLKNKCDIKKEIGDVINLEFLIESEKLSFDDFDKLTSECVLEYVRKFSISSEKSDKLSLYKSIVRNQSKDILSGVPIFDISDYNFYDIIVKMGLYILERNDNTDFEKMMISSDKSGNGYLETRGVSLDERIKDILLNNTRDKLNFYSILYDVLENFISNQKMLPSLIYVFSTRRLEDADIFVDSHDFCEHPFKNRSLEYVLDETNKIYSNNELSMPRIIFWNLSDRLSEDVSYSPVKRHENLFEINGYNNKLFELYLEGKLI